jgi:tetratricopeptide (TPR) repeat protein
VAVAKRRTAVLEIRSPSESKDLLALDVQRRYSFVLTIDGRQAGGGDFSSPIGDEAWRTLIQAMREATETEGAAETLDAFRRQAEAVKDAGRKLFRHLGEIAPALQAFLAPENEPRRFVVLSRRPEIHLLPFEAMVDSQWRSVAETDLSVVHAVDLFDEQPTVEQAPLTIEGIFGPRTEKRTLKSLQALRERAQARSGGRILVAGLDPASAPEGRPATQAQVVHVEAHGDPKTGELDLERRDALETPLSERLQSRSMVLLWSCYSAMVHSWGESLGMKLHSRGNAFVLSFATPLRYDTGEELAGRFYDQAFGDKVPIDPETVVVKERARLYRDRLRACEWAALTLWLRGPVDLGPAVFSGPRLLPANEGDRALSASEVKLLRAAVQQALPGRLVLLERFRLRGRLPEGLFDGIRGAVVHSRAEMNGDANAGALDTHAVKPRSVHRGDRLLALIDALQKQPGSLLLWSGVGSCEVQALSLHGALPPSLSVLLISPWRLPRALGMVRLDGGQTHAPAKPTGVDEISRVEELTEAGRNRQAVQLAQGLATRARLTKNQQRRLFTALYWAHARLSRYEQAEAMIRKVAALDPFEGSVLRGNLAVRRGLYEEARTTFSHALAQTKNDRDRARAKIELAGVAAATADDALAERLYGEAIATLEAVTDEPNEPRWHSALGRSLRDLADLLAKDPARSDECESHLRRALVIHNLDGRFGQVGAVLETRGILERTSGRFDAAEGAFVTAAGIFDSSDNVGSWADAIRESADLAFRMGHYERALELVLRARSRLRRVASDHRTVLGGLALIEARIHWRRGSLERAHQACADATSLLPPERVHDHAAAGQLKALLESLVKNEGGSSTTTQPFPGPPRRRPAARRVKNA